MYMRFFINFALSVAFFSNLSAQESLKFKMQEQLYLKGNSILIGNTVLGKHKKTPFDDMKTANDAVNMKYVDVDQDETTFSSSSAQILMPSSAQRVVYAGLYWSGLYPSERSEMRKKKRKIIYKNKGRRVPTVNEIKVKVSGQPYFDVKGEILFDAKKKGAFKTDSPYLCRADLTAYFQKHSSENAVFTAANIRGVNGKIAGGSAAGWLLYIIYEDASETPKYFTIYDGFEQVNYDNIDISFEDFQGKTEGALESTLIMASLDGDVNIESDQCAIYNSKTNQYEILKTPQRESTNFFNSSITSGSTTKSERTPASKNTLGFDLVKMKLPSGIISNNATTSKVRFKTGADRFYLFFTAFETEIENTYLLRRNSEIAFSEGKIELGNKLLQESKLTKKESLVIPEATAAIVLPSTILLDPHQTNNVLIPGMASGYYLVTNVFSKNKYADSWTKKMLDQGYQPRSYVNPENGWRYIYIETSNKLLDIVNRKNELRSLKQFKKAWITGINL